MLRRARRGGGRGGPRRRNPRTRSRAPEPALPRAAGGRACPRGSACRRRSSCRADDDDPDGPPVEADAEDEASGALYQGGGGIGESDVPAEPDDEPFVLERGPRTVVLAGADAGPDAEELAHDGGLAAHRRDRQRCAVRPAPRARLPRAAARRRARRPHRARRRARASDPQPRGRGAALATPMSRSSRCAGPGEPLNLNGAHVRRRRRRASRPATPIARGSAQWLHASRRGIRRSRPARPRCRRRSRPPTPGERLAGRRRRARRVVRRPLDRAAPRRRRVAGDVAARPARLRLVAPRPRRRPGARRARRCRCTPTAGSPGIDGTIATATGIALASQAGGAPGVTRVLLGDLAFLHDVGRSLLAAGRGRAAPPGHRRQRRRRHDLRRPRGGGVRRRRRRSTACSTRRTRCDLEQLALAYGWEYRAGHDRGGARPGAHVAASAGRQLIEVPLRALTRGIRHRWLHDAPRVTEALDQRRRRAPAGRRRLRPRRRRPRLDARVRGGQAARRRGPRRRRRSSSTSARSGCSRAAASTRRTRAVLLVLQAMDTAGKGGIVRHVVGAVDPQGVRSSAFKKPTDEELEHDFLWRIEQALPAAGLIGVFDRSHYEDVLIGRVRELAPPDEIERRYDAINEFEKRVADDRHADRQGDAAHLAGRAEGAAHGAARPPRQALEVQPGRRRRARAVADVHGGVPDRLRAHLDRRTRRGTWCPPTASGTRASRCSTCCSTRSRSIDPQWPAATSTSRPRRRGSRRAERARGQTQSRRPQPPSRSGVIST